MQVFLPYPDFARSVSCLDPSRLGNQIYRECLTLVRGGWPNHPASRMWQGYEYWLCEYALEGLQELTRRGKHYPQHYETFERLQKDFEKSPLPWWLGDDRLHSSHRAALLYKDYRWYSQFGWTEETPIPNSKGSLPYFWPV